MCDPRFKTAVTDYPRDGKNGVTEIFLMYWCIARYRGTEIPEEFSELMDGDRQFESDYTEFARSMDRQCSETP